MSEKYDLKSVKLPRIAGLMLKVMCNLLENSTTASLLAPSLLKDAGITAFRKLELSEPPTFLPLYSETSSTPFSVEPLPLPQHHLPGKFQFASISNFSRQYQSGEISPTMIAERYLSAVEQSNKARPALRAIIDVKPEDIRRQAAESTERLNNGKTLGILDGIPIPVKDEIDLTPYRTRVGTRFLGRTSAEEDSTIAARLRRAGAMLVGKANMHEIGIGVTGLNPHYGIARNPYHPDHFTGGSSSGPAAAVAAGLAPAAIGADGGGSIRIPSSFCGLVGLKSTFGRVSEFGAAPLCWSVAHIGPLACSALDAAWIYAIIAGKDERDPNTWNQPIPSLVNFNKTELNDLSIGVYWPWFRHASQEVVSVCEGFLGKMESAGAKIVAIEIPGLEAMRVAHLVTIASEMLTSMMPYLSDHQDEFGLDVRTNLALAQHFTSTDYVLAQRIRTQAMKTFGLAFQKVDVIATPATGISSPKIPLDAIPDGESDLTTLAEIMRFAVPANLTGLPAISFPVGYTNENLPIGFQVMGRPWNEHTLLRLANFADQVVERLKPVVYWDLLSSN